MTSRKIINSKLKEAVDSVLPITLIVAVLCFFFVPVGSGLMLAFLVGAVMLILGMGLFTLGAELSMTQMGNLVGAKMTKSRRLWLILVLAFVLGVVITIAEPDLQVLAQNVPGHRQDHADPHGVRGRGHLPDHLHAAYPAGYLLADAAADLLCHRVYSGRPVRPGLPVRGL